MRQLGEYIAQYGITHLVLGFPKYMDGSLSPRCAVTQAFADKLQRNFKRLEIVLWDERLSTQAVARMYAGDRALFKQKVDEMAAVYILQGYLDSLKETAMDDFNEGIVMYDDQGNEQLFQVLASQEADGVMYLLAVAGLPNDAADEDEDAEVLHLKCMNTNGGNDEDMIFEVVDEEHEDFDKVLVLFKADYEALDIIIEE